MNISKDISELVTANVISQETASKIQNYYKEKGIKSSNKILVIFGILGALLIGLGVILIVAHNWDEFSKTIKLFFAFLPLVIAQIISGYSLIKKSENSAWKESSATFLFFTIGANISLIGQIYNLHENLGFFLLTWMLIFFPIIYVMKSSTASLLYIIGITFYACETGYWAFPISESINYWILLILIFPFYYLLYKKNPQSNFFNIHNWVIPLSITISLGIVADNFEEFLYIAYFNLFILFHIIGSSEFFKNQKAKINGYTFFGSLGIVVILLILSFDWFWESLRNKYFNFREILISPEFLVSMLISLLAIGLLIKNSKVKSANEINPVYYSLILFIVIFFIGIHLSISVIFINLLVLAIGIITIKQGIKQNHLGILNYGLLIITALITCRFFDSDLTFITRGIIFIIVGIGFFSANYWILKKRKLDEK
ncbi:MAG: DUF2157 domain-containing protein [Melioribacteraceae bacterium]